MEIQTCRFFMGANTKDGFFSLFHRVAEEQESVKLYTVKGGPGCGKSTAVAKIAAAFTRPGERVEYIPCASDPASLDGALLHDRGLALLDGTAPHVTDPALPGAGGGYITCPPFRDLPGLESRQAELRGLKGRSADHYAQAYRLITAACRIEEGLRAKTAALLPAEKLLRRVAGIARREIPRQEGPGALRLRLLDGITPDGVLCLWDTVAAMAPKVYMFEDTYGLAEPTLGALRDIALERGHLVYACLCPKDPSRLRHLILPGLGLAFVTDSGAPACPLPAYRRVRVDAYIGADGLRPMRGRLKLLLRTARSLLDDAVEELAAARALHDRMEALYRPHIDFEALDGATAQAIEIIGQGACGL